MKNAVTWFEIPSTQLDKAQAFYEAVLECKMRREPMRRADRLFHLVQLIRGRRLSTAEFLAKRLEVSERTIYRDVADLQHQGVPIEGEAGVGYRLGAGFDLPPLMFTQKEANALAASVRLAQAWLDPAMDFLISWVLPAVAVLAFWMARQATPGKMAIAARIVDADTGNNPSTGQLLIRYLGYFVSSIPLGLGIFWVAFDSRKQGWHDKMAGTVVVRKKSGTTRPVEFNA